MRAIGSYLVACQDFGYLYDALWVRIGADDAQHLTIIRIQKLSRATLARTEAYQSQHNAPILQALWKYPASNTI